MKDKEYIREIAREVAREEVDLKWNEMNTKIIENYPFCSC